MQATTTVRFGSVRPGGFLDPQRRSAASAAWTPSTSSDWRLESGSSNAVAKKECPGTKARMKIAASLRHARTDRSRAANSWSADVNHMAAATANVTAPKKQLRGASAPIGPHSPQLSRERQMLLGALYK